MKEIAYKDTPCDVPDFSMIEKWTNLDAGFAFSAFKEKDLLHWSWAIIERYINNRGTVTSAQIFNLVEEPGFLSQMNFLKQRRVRCSS